MTGDQDDAFLVGNKMGLSGIFPVSKYQKYNFSAQMYEPITLNGLSIEILSESAGVYTLEVKYDDFTLDQNTRWCGNLELPNLNGDELVLSTGKELLIDLGGTPDRITPSPLTATFTNPTEFTLQPGAKMRLKSQSDMVVQRHSTFRMQAGSILEIENGAELRIDSTASFIMEPGSIVNVHGNGEILIARGAHYFYGQGASLGLLDNNSCISIKGGWKLGENATFTFTGNGFVYLGLPQTPGNVSLDGMNAGFSIWLQGSGPTDQILVIEDNTYLDPETNLDEFKILNGRVLMGADARILLTEATNIELQNMQMLALNPPAKHKGMFISGISAHTIDQIQVHDGTDGILYWQGPTPNNTRLHISNSNFLYNGNAVRTFGNSAVLENVGMYLNDEGWRAWGSTLPGAYISSTVQSGISGIHYHGGMGDLFFEESESSDHIWGLIAEGDITFLARCGDIVDNHTGLMMYYGATLDLSAYPNNQIPAQLNASNNDQTISLTQANTIRFAGGYNDFRPASTGYASIVEGSLTSSCLTIDAVNNAWKTSGSGPVQGTGPSGDYAITGPGACAVAISDPDPQAAQACGAISPPCPGCPPDETTDPVFYCPTCETITLSINPASGGGTAQSLPLNESLQAAMQEMRRYDPANGNDAEAAWRMLQILEYNYGAINNEEAYLLGVAYESLKRAFSSHIVYGEVQLSEGQDVPSLDELSTALLAYIDDRIQDNPSYSEGLRYLTDRAIFYQALGYRSQALDAFDDAIHWAKGNDQDPIETWICLLNHEQDLVEAQITLHDFFDLLPGCAGGGSSARMAAPAQAPEPAAAALAPEEKTLRIYPNPADYTLTVEMQQEIPGPLRLTLLDLQGRVIRRWAENRTFDAGTHVLTLKTGDWAPGLYLLRLESGSVSVVEKVRIAR